MKRFFLITLCLVSGLFIIAASAHALPTTVTFVDNEIHWPGYSVKPADDSYGPDNTREQIGEPGLKGGQVVVDGGFVKSVGIDGAGYQINANSGSLSLKWLERGDLFLATGLSGSGNWDFVVKSYRGSVTIDTNDAPTYTVYEAPSGGIALSGGSAVYLMTGGDNTGVWAGYDVRNQHPYALKSFDNLTVWGQASFTGYVETNGMTEWTFIRNDGSRGLPYQGGSVTVGWTVSCANDVIYETVSVPVPEPGTLLLLGAGLIGVAAFGTRRLRRKG